jgi:hypothetical protein
MYLGRGTMTVEARPAAFEGDFHTSSLEIALTQGDTRELRGNGSVLEPLPPAEQPDPNDPLGDGGPTNSPDPNATPGPSASPDGGGIDPPCCKPINPVPPPVAPGAPDAPGVEVLPAFQLFDRTTQQWVEFPQPDVTSSYLIADPQRYVDSSGAVLLRFVNRSEAGQFGEDQRSFRLQIRLEGTIGS